MNDRQTAQVKVAKMALPEKMNLEEWLAEQDKQYEWLLAHAYAGVIWGRRFAHGWELSSERIPSSPPLDAGSLLQLRLFGKKGEIFIWRAGGKLQARQISEGDEGENLDVIDDVQILWGSKGEQIDDHFTRLEDGEQGMVHAVPLTMGTFDASSWRPLRLHMRHYLTQHEETGLARIGFSRLRTLTHKEVNGNGS